MAYIGKAPVNGYHAKQTLTGDGSTVTFSLDQTVASETSIIVSVGGVIQEPKTAYDLVTAGTQITFTAAPASTDRVYIHFLGTAVVQNLLDVNGAEFILDVDGDTSLTADTDDEIDIRVGGTDRSTIKATGFHNIDSIKFVAGTGDDMQMYHDGTNSYLTNATGALKIATETSGIALTIGHTTSEVTVADNMTVTGNLTIGGTTNFGDFDISNVGSIALDTITNDGTDITLDSSGDIVLDAAGNDIFLKDAGTTYGSLTATGSNLIIKSGTTTAATFSGANVTLAGTVGSGNITSTGTVQGTTITATTAFVPDASDGAALGTTALEFSDLFLADGAVINFGDDQDITLTHTADTGLATNGTFSATTITATTAFVPDASDGAALGTTALEFSDLYLADGAVIGFGDDQEVTLTHVHDTGLLLSSTDQLQFGDSGTYIHQSADGVLDLVSDTEIEINATTIDINGNVEISGTATTTGVHTFTAVPVFPNNTIETADIQADAVDGTKIADDAIDSEHYTDGSIDNAHIADDAIDSEHYADGSIDNAHIADDAIDSEHYADGSIDTAHIADGQVTIGKLATAVLTGATDIGEAIVDADLLLVDNGAGGTLRKTTASRLKTYITPGITVASQFRLTTDFTGDANPIASNWEEVDTYYSRIGSAVTESSGIFTMPSTGVYWIVYHTSVQYNGENNYHEAILQGSSDGFSSDTATIASKYSSSSDHGTTSYYGASCHAIYDVTSTSNNTIKCRVNVEDDSATTKGSSSNSQTSLTIMRLGDT